VAIHLASNPAYTDGDANPHTDSNAHAVADSDCNAYGNQHAYPTAAG
jgi:hypothetical protein